MSDKVTDVDALQACVGKLPGPRDLKVIDYLDDNAVRWIAASPFLFATFGDATHIEVTAAGGAIGFVHVDDAKQLSIPTSLIDDPQLPRIGQGFGSLFLVPGIDETLRANGRVTGVSDQHITIAVDECYLHCAKALIRSEFWAAQPLTGETPADPMTQLGISRFMALGTMDVTGRADLSPKGDPAGALLKVAQDDVVFPDRPGNRRIDSFRNILTQPRVAAIALVPGSANLTLIRGQASIVTNEALRALFEVQEKIPNLVTRIEPVELRSYRSEAVQRARLWPAVRTANDLDPADIFKAHVKLSRSGGLGATLARAAVSVPGLMRQGLNNDYKNNLY